MAQSTVAEANTMLSQMTAASSVFYRMAVTSGCHAFVEFTGLVNEYIKVCETMTSRGDLSWMTANTHTENSFPFLSFNVAYIAEKLDCIYGPSLRANSELRRVFFGE